VKSTSITAYTVIDDVTRRIEGVANINGKEAFPFIGIVSDNGEPGSNDSFSLRLSNGYAGLALIPLAMGGDLPGNEIQSPMAKVILGGLLSSTLLNIFVVPIVYHMSQRNAS
jgi:Putative silver efflux pump